MTLYTRESTHKNGDQELVLLQCYDYDQSNCTIAFEYFFVISKDGIIYLIGEVINIDKIKDKNNLLDGNKWIILPIHTQDYDVYDYQTKSNKKRSVDRFERFIEYCLTKELILENTWYQGNIIIKENQIGNTIMTEPSLEATLMNKALVQTFQVDLVEPEKETPDIQFEVIEQQTNRKSNYQRETELDRLNQRACFIVQEINKLPPEYLPEGKPFSSLADISLRKEKVNSQVQEIYKELTVSLMRICG